MPEQLRQKAMQEIQKRGLKEQDVREQLLARGIDIDQMSIEQLQAAQPQIEAVINEMESAQNAAQQQGDKLQVQDTQKNSQENLDPGEGLESRQLEEAQNNMERQKEAPDGNSKKEGNASSAISSDSLYQIYGQQIFQDKSLEVYESSRDIKPPGSYILGVGDIINVSIFGVSQADLQFEIEIDGFIRPAKMPRIYLKGIRYGALKGLLIQRFSKAYRFQPDQFAVSIDAARTMTINIFGEVEHGGSFTLSAINTAFNALVAAGGPTEIGSVRKIQLIRNGESQYLDVYGFMQNPNLQYEYHLEDNDILFVPIAEKVVNIEGAVKRPMHYELLDGEELMALLDFAGGLNANAYTDFIQIRRYAANKETLINVSLQRLLDNGEDFALRNGDQVFIKRVPEAVENLVSIEGAVELPGNYAMMEGLRVSDLLQYGVLQEEARLDLAFLFRRRLDNSLKLFQINLEKVLANTGQAEDLLLTRRDRLLVFTQERFVDTYKVSVTGAVREGMELEYESDMRISDLISLAGGLSPQATDFAYLLRRDYRQPDDLEYKRVDLAVILSNPNSEENLLLKPMDELRILNRNTYVDQSTVRVSGAVRSPGEYPYDSTLSIENLLVLAGGLKLEAASNRIDIFRLQMDSDQPTRTLMETISIDKEGLLTGNAGTDYRLDPFDQVVVRSVPEFEFQQSIRLEGEVRYPGTYALLEDNERISDLIERAGGLTKEADLSAAVLNRSENGIGVVVIELEKALQQNGSNADIILKKGDVLSIPKSRDLVSIRVIGTEANNMYGSNLMDGNRINVTHQGDKSARWYIINYASGFAKNARRNSTTVMYANGRIKGTEEILFIRDYPKVKPGSEIWVDLKPPKREKEKRESLDWGKIASDVLTSATATLSLILLIQRI